MMKVDVAIMAANRPHPMLFIELPCSMLLPRLAGLGCVFLRLRI